jgi:tetratricopeptide (TPR) repeat protein
VLAEVLRRAATQWTTGGARVVRKALAIDKHLAAARGLGTVSNGSGDADAKAANLKALETDEINDEALWDWRLRKEHLGNSHEAEETSSARSIGARYWASRTWLAQFYRDQGRYREAADQFQQAVSLTPDNATAWTSLGSPTCSWGATRTPSKHRGVVRSPRPSTPIRRSG